MSDEAKPTSEHVQFPEIEAALAQYLEKKQMEPSNVTQFLSFCKAEGLQSITYSKASKYFRIKQGLTSTPSSQHSKPSKMYSKYYAPPAGKSGVRRSSQPVFGISKEMSSDGTKRRESEPVDGNGADRSVKLDGLISEYNASKGVNDSNNMSPFSPASPVSPLPSVPSISLTQAEKLEIQERKRRFQKENEQLRLSVYQAMAASATDEHVEEVYDDVDAADAAAIEQIHASVEAAFKALVASMKSHGTRLTQSKEQLQIIDQQMEAAKTAIVKEFDVAMGTLLKRRNGLLKALEVAHDENSKYLKQQIKHQQNSSNLLIQCKDDCREHVKNKKTKEAIEAVVGTLNKVRPDKPELATINLEYKQTDPKLNDFLENYGTLSVAKTMRTKKKKDGNDDDAKGN